MDNLKSYIVTFKPLVKAPKKLKLYVIKLTVEATDEHGALHLAGSELLEAGFERKYFMKKADILRVTTNDENTNSVDPDSSQNQTIDSEDQAKNSNAESLEKNIITPEFTQDPEFKLPPELIEDPVLKIKVTVDQEQKEKTAAALGLDTPASPITEELDPAIAAIITGELLEKETFEYPSHKEILAAELECLNEKINALKPGDILKLGNISNELYHASIGVSCSKIKVMIDECPAAYDAVVTGVREYKSSPIFNIGSAAHGVILEPENFERDFIVMPVGLKKPTVAQLKAAVPTEKTAIQIQAWDAWQDVHGHKTQLTEDQYKTVEMIRDSVITHPFSRRLVKKGQAEVSFWRRDDLTGLIIKARTDYILGDLIIDVKTCENSEPVAFAKHAVNYGYHVQDSFYRHVTGYKEFAFLAVEKKAPCVVTAPLLFDAEAKRLGQLLFRSALNTIAECQDSGEWPGHATGVSSMSLPAWETRKIQELEINEDFNQSQGAA